MPFLFLFGRARRTPRVTWSACVVQAMARKRTPRKRPSGAEEQSPSKDFITVDGVVRELLPSTTFRIELENGHEVRGYLAGRMRMHRIRILPGDRVRVELTPYDLRQGRIVYRY